MRVARVAGCAMADEAGAGRGSARLKHQQRAGENSGQQGVMEPSRNVTVRAPCAVRVMWLALSALLAGSRRPVTGTDLTPATCCGINPPVWGRAANPCLLYFQAALWPFFLSVPPHLDWCSVGPCFCWGWVRANVLSPPRGVGGPQGPLSSS